MKRIAVSLEFVLIGRVDVQRFCRGIDIQYVSLGGLVVIVFAIGPKVRGFRSGRGR
jgi:hypothetical protein